ncbi:DEAD/DEAH box helicase [Sphingobium sp. BHU LFT2]|nr:DEAD/DEAH box helicase [Sphingobium sp. BHU LFT2]
MSLTRGTGEIVLMLSEGLCAGDVLYLADNEQDAEVIAGGLAALLPSDHVVHVPSSDTLPGDRAPASPANIGRRVAALRALRQLAITAKRPRHATIMTGEAAARFYADPAAFDPAPPVLRNGDAIDLEGFAAHMESIGYISDDRVDEPGEVAVRGDVIDIFPADAGLPARIHVSNGQIVGIRRYDPATQLTQKSCDVVEIGRAAEPDASAHVSILAHLAPGHIYLAPNADERRRRFIRLARDSANQRGAVDAVSQELWKKDLTLWTEGKAEPSLSSIPRFIEKKSPLSALKRFVAPMLQDGLKLLLVGSERDIRFLRPRLAKIFVAEVETVQSLSDMAKIPPAGVAVLVAPIDRGAMDGKIVMVAAADILGSRATIDVVPANLAGRSMACGDIRVGDLVVHEEHGIGRVVGLAPSPGGSGEEVLSLAYSGGDRLVTVHDAGRIWRYGGDGDAVKLDKLDGSSWRKRKGSIDEAVAQSARELLRLAQERKGLTAPIIDPIPASYEQFVATFPFNETPDQASAIQAMRDDLAAGRPMDRLIIGDVGYGKTEIALRAAALAALAGYQVVLAAPTTVLVRQHIETFARRFAGTAVTVTGLSRLSSAGEKKAVKAGLADGSIDIVIGTAGVVAENVSYAKLGLVIIDEEQRFGAADKARLRGRPDIHLLAMSATPIPRTLHRAMIGLQQVSVIGTPPARRQPIRTSLATFDDALVRTTLLRERSRGGQSSVVVPRINDMGPLAERLSQIAPDFTFIQAHGKMPASGIDEAMMRFADGDGDVLLATNIIEAGLDLPRANSMIIWRADRFGLAQLHQLRGRVGRGNRRGQVILLTEGKRVAERTMKRLRALATYDQLGAGFEISAADLDQRGAGDPLADTQAGHMKLIGVDLYQHLFEGALREAEEEGASRWQPELNLGEAGALPAEWIPDPDIRIGLYVRLARVLEERDLDLFEAELTDRFGPHPVPVERLLAAARIGILARSAGIARVDAGPAAIALTPYGGALKVPEGLQLIQKKGRWLLKEPNETGDRLQRVMAVLEALVTTGD